MSRTWRVEACPVLGCDTLKTDACLVCREHWNRLPFEARQPLLSIVKRGPRTVDEERALQSAVTYLEARDRLMTQIRRLLDGRSYAARHDPSARPGDVPPDLAAPGALP